MSHLVGSLNEGVPTRAIPSPDPTWRGVYVVGGVCIFVVGLAYLLGALLSIVLGPPPSAAEEYLKALALHPILARLNFGLFTVADFMLLVGSLALYLSLKGIAKNEMLLATALLALFVILDLSITELNSLVLVNLTGQYATAATAAQRTAFVAAADYALATLPIGTFLSYFVSSAGWLIASVVMLRGIFSKATAYLGIVASIAAIIASFYVVVPPLALLLTPSLVAFAAWSILAGARLYKIGREITQGPVANTATA